jgi:hypothetical protein
VYGDTVYHHGAGLRSRNQFTRFHVSLAPKPQPLSPIPAVRQVRRRRDWQRRQSWDEQMTAQLSALSDSVYASIQNDDAWLTAFI